MPKQRPRFNGRSAHLSHRYRHWLEDARASMRKQWEGPPLPLLEDLEVSFHGPARSDIDNLLGAVLDAGTGILWVNDRVSVIPQATARFFKDSLAKQEIHILITS